MIRILAGFAFAAACCGSTLAQLAIRAGELHPVTGPVLRDAVVIVRDGKVAAVGPAASTPIPDGFTVLEAAVVTPGLIDGHSTVGLTGILNGDGATHDQDMLEPSSPIQPQLRAIDAYNPLDPLVEYLRSFGITTVHTGHGPGELISGQTIVVKTAGTTVADALVREGVAVAATLDPSALKSGGKSPGTRAKAMAMLRQELIKAREYATKQSRSAEPGEDGSPNEPPTRDLELEALAGVLDGSTPLLLTADRAQDIASALRLADEFGLTLWLDSGAESYLMLDELKAAGVPVFVHPAMIRPWGDRENASMRTAGVLADAGVTVVSQSGYEGYVPKVRVVLFEAGISAAHGLGRQRALESITITPARLLGISDRIGSIEVGKDADLALYDGDPFEYTTHCIGVVIDGGLVSTERR